MLIPDFFRAGVCQANCIDHPGVELGHPRGWSALSRLDTDRLGHDATE
jgi:hypothetical protein